MSRSRWRDAIDRHANAFRFWRIMVDGREIGRELARNAREACDRYAAGSTYARDRMTAEPATP